MTLKLVFGDDVRRLGDSNLENLSNLKETIASIWPALVHPFELRSAGKRIETDEDLALLICAHGDAGTSVRIEVRGCSDEVAEAPGAASAGTAPPPPLRPASSSEVAPAAASREGPPVLGNSALVSGVLPAPGTYRVQFPDFGDIDLPLPSPSCVLFASYGSAVSPEQNTAFSKEVRAMVERDGGLHVKGGPHTVIGDPEPGVSKMLHLWFTVPVALGVTVPSITPALPQTAFVHSAGPESVTPPPPDSARDGSVSGMCLGS